ncbi:HD domain-containing protein [Candidatus Gottesmanbacteria bacterium]|nr:HD domain-containing protein [Candidatus Gottesmanbacteria bacterium]
MIPTRQKIDALWNTHNLPPLKRNHCMLVARLAVWFAQRLMAEGSVKEINIPLLEAAALLHDIDKMVPKLPHEQHPDAGVRILTAAGYPLIADLVKTHPLHAILDQNIAPRSIEQKLLYLSDKMVKHEIITVDQRFALWRSENLPATARDVLDRSYPLVKALETEVCGVLRVAPEDVAKLANTTETSTMNVSH